MNTEVIANVWSFIRGSYIQELDVRLYMISGTDDEKTEFLKTLAPFDFPFSRRFPVPENLKGKKVKGIEAAFGGVDYLNYFRESWDTVIKSLPVHLVGLTGKVKASAPFTGKNLLSVYTAVEVDSDGNHHPCLPDKNLSMDQSKLLLCRWAFADQKTSEVFATAGRAYLAAGNDGQLVAILANLATDDYLLASRCALPKIAASSDPSALLSNPSSFKPVLQDIQQSISASKLDIASQKAAIFTFRPTLATVKTSVVMENQNGKTSISSVSAQLPDMSMPITTRCTKCGKTLKCKSELAGKRVKCPACKEAILVPLQESGSPSSTPDSARPASHAPQKRSFFWMAVWCQGRSKVRALATESQRRTAIRSPRSVDGPCVLRECPGRACRPASVVSGDPES